jgi:AcrR family transcriptional regulator
VFAEKGYDAATMTEIAARGESSIGSLYQFFPTKPDVAQGLIALQADELRQRLAAMVDASAGWEVDELSARLVVVLIEFRAAHPSFARLVDSPGAPAEQVQAVRQAMRLQLAEILAPHASGLTKARLAAVAVAVQQVMKAAVTLNTEGAPGTRAALSELKEMLRVYLRAALQA